MTYEFSNRVGKLPPACGRVDFSPREFFTIAQQRALFDTPSLALRVGVGSAKARAMDTRGLKPTLRGLDLPHPAAVGL